MGGHGSAQPDMIISERMYWSITLRPWRSTLAANDHVNTNQKSGSICDSSFLMSSGVRRMPASVG